MSTDAPLCLSLEHQLCGIGKILQHFPDVVVVHAAYVLVANIRQPILLPQAHPLCKTGIYAGDAHPCLRFRLSAEVEL